MTMHYALDGSILDSLCLLTGSVGEGTDSGEGLARIRGDGRPSVNQLRGGIIV